MRSVVCSVLDGAMENRNEIRRISAAEDRGEFREAVYNLPQNAITSTSSPLEALNTIITNHRFSESSMYAVADCESSSRPKSSGISLIVGSTCSLPHPHGLTAAIRRE